MNTARNITLFTGLLSGAGVAAAQNGQPCSDATGRPVETTATQPCIDYAGYAPLLPPAEIPIPVKNHVHHLMIATVSVPGKPSVITVTDKPIGCYEAGKAAAIEAHAATQTTCRDTHGNVVATEACASPVANGKPACVVTFLPHPRATKPVETATPQ